MILFYNPRATKPRNRRFPLSILAIAAVIEGQED
jgi:anaerobic magnesium-protoporphyrin IX monomethyl ester cyclase